MNPNLRSIEADPADIKPLGDFVLVKKISDVDGMYKGVIHLPPHKQTAEVDWVPQIGVVVACGPGDRAIVYVCDHGGIARKVATWRDNPPCYRTVLIDAVRPKCERCRADMEVLVYADSGKMAEQRFPMHVSVGDEVIYQRWPDNDININGDEYTFLHEEQAILAVLEKEVAA
jgi:co-chaperonin GroES (HSP10)